MIAADLILGTARLLAAVGVAFLIGAGVALFTDAGFDLQSAVVVLMTGLLVTPVIARVGAHQSSGQTPSRESTKMLHVIERLGLYDRGLKRFLFHFAVGAFALLFIGTVIEGADPDQSRLGALATVGGFLIGTVASHFFRNGVAVVALGAAGFIVTGVLTPIFFAAVRVFVLS